MVIFLFGHKKQIPESHPHDSSSDFSEQLLYPSAEASITFMFLCHDNYSVLCSGHSLVTLDSLNVSTSLLESEPQKQA